MEQSAQLELLFSDDTYQLTGVARSKNGRLFTNYPLWPGPRKYGVVEVLSEKESRPYPNEEMNSWKDGDDGKNNWVCVQAVYSMIRMHSGFSILPARLWKRCTTTAINW